MAAYNNRVVQVKADSTSGTVIGTLNHATVNTITVDVSDYDKIAIMPYSSSLTGELGYHFNYELS